jgi:hypothetical protein
MKLPKSSKLFIFCAIGKVKRQWYEAPAAQIPTMGFKKKILAAISVVGGLQYSLVHALPFNGLCWI